MKKRLGVGITAAICSALLFGISPAIAKLAYEGGSNPVTMTFTRALFAIFFGAFGTTILLYSSYAYIGVGTATVLHYVFPVLVMLGGLLFFKEKLLWWKVLALAFGFLGVLSFIGERGQHDPRGILLALLSSVFIRILSRPPHP